MKRVLFFLFLLIHVQAKNYNIAILAIFGEERSAREWQPTIDYLNRAIPQHHFNLIPVSFKNIKKFKSLIDTKKVDYLLTNPLIYVNLELTSHISKMATLVKSEGISQFGSVIISSGESNITKIEDIRNRTIAGIGKKGFGGWLVAYNELLDHGFDAYKDAKEVLFLGTQGRVLQAVIDQEVDVGIVRTGIIEDAIKRGIITNTTLRVLNKQEYQYFNHLCSTRLYPEWAFAKTDYASDDVSREVKKALLSIKSNSDVAKSAHYWKWSIPYSYRNIHVLMEKLSIGEYKEINKVSFEHIVDSYGDELVIAFILLSLLLLSLVIMIYIKNKKLSVEIIKNKNMANHDALTSLYNRNFMYAYQERWLKEASSKSAIIFIDLDNFKNINDTFGHNYGDIILIEVSQRITSFINEDSLAIRQGGDEFIILKHAQGDRELDIFISDLIFKIAEPYHIDGLEFIVGCSAGISIFKEHSIIFNELLSFADIAMYKAKENKNSFIIFNETMKQEHMHNARIEQELHSAVQKNELFVLYQPQINAAQELYGVEALVRWKNANLGFVSPADFIPIAESSGLMIEIGDFIMKEALREVSQLQSKEGKKFHLSLNISVKQLVQEKFTSKIDALVKEHALHNEYITLEVTETIFIKDLNYVIPILDELKEKGFKIALDDFGTGFSSLNILKNLPIDELKIDKSFIDKIHNKKDKLMLQNIIKIGKDLGMLLVAEGVENKDQVQTVYMLECDIIQGYYYSKPLSIEALDNFSIEV